MNTLHLNTQNFVYQIIKCHYVKFNQMIKIFD